ncbi:MAG: hypothetical protein JXA69_02925 [Phycisphaerae bacterium]|nr:hypothetical protein [Phycisphaerae bacterium]
MRTWTVWIAAGVMSVLAVSTANVARGETETTVARDDGKAERTPESPDAPRGPRGYWRHGDSAPDDGEKGPRDRRGPYGRGPMYGFGPETLDRGMAFLKEHYPELHDRLQHMKENDSLAFQRQMRRIMPRLPELIELADRDPDLAKLIFREHQLEMDIREVFVQYRDAEDAALAAEFKGRLTELVSEQFDVRQEKLKLMIADLERQLEQKKQALAEREQKKAEIIDLELRRRLNPDI